MAYLGPKRRPNDETSFGPLVILTRPVFVVAACDGW
jgi:hypothetical protein